MDERMELAVPSWVLAMRQAAQKLISQADIEEIVRNQVAAAKAGNKDAIRFVFQQVLGGEGLRGATFVQNVYQGDTYPNRPTKALPGTKDKIAEMRRRVASGQSAINPNDARPDEA